MKKFKIKIKKMPSKEMLERFIEGLHSDFTGKRVYFDLKKGKFVE